MLVPTRSSPKSAAARCWRRRRSVTVDGHRGIWLVGAHQPLDRQLEQVQVGRVELMLSVYACEPGGFEQAVALAERDLERLAEAQDHLAARSRPAGFEERQMA